MISFFAAVRTLLELERRSFLAIETPKFFNLTEFSKNCPIDPELSILTQNEVFTHFTAIFGIDHDNPQLC